jgi:hypothetical protein
MAKKDAPEIPASQPSGGMSPNLLPEWFDGRDVSYALNAVLYQVEQTSVAYQNEYGNKLVATLPEDTVVIGAFYIQERKLLLFFLASERGGEIGYVSEETWEYTTVFKADCLNFKKQYPINKIAYRADNCRLLVFWTDTINPRRYIDVFSPPDSCDKLLVDPAYSIPIVTAKVVPNAGTVTSGAYQFAVQYCDANGSPLTIFHSLTNPIPVSDPNVIRPDLDYSVNKGFEITISNLDTTGIYKYFQVIVVRTVSVGKLYEIVGVYGITGREQKIVYNGNYIRQTTSDELTQKFLRVEKANDLTVSDDILIWVGLTTYKRRSYQDIANKINLKWATWRLPPGKNFSDENIASQFRGYMRGETYPFSIVFILRNGRETDAFHIPGRKKKDEESIIISDADPNNPLGRPAETWEVKDTSTILFENPAALTDPNYEGIYQIGEFGYHESSETYPNDDLWGENKKKPIRHHRFPSNTTAPFLDTTEPPTSSGEYTNLSLNERAIYPIGVYIDPSEIRNIIYNSQELSEEEKAEIVGFKILRGERSINNTVVAKGIFRNVGKYKKQISESNAEYFFVNYPYNDLREDPFLLERSNKYYEICAEYKVSGPSGEIKFTDCYTGQAVVKNFTSSFNTTVCSLTPPTASPGCTVTAVVLEKYKITLKKKRAVNYAQAVIGYRDKNNNPRITTIFIDGWGRATKEIELSVYPGTIPQVISATGERDPVGIARIYDYGVRDISAVCYPKQLNAFGEDDLFQKNLLAFNSPETSFGYPTIRDTIVRIEGALYGRGSAHFVKVKNQARQRIITRFAQNVALKQANDFAPTDPQARMTAFNTLLQIYLNRTELREYEYSYNSFVFYNYFKPANTPFVRKTKDARYLDSGNYILDNNKYLNNINRENSVLLELDTTNAIPYAEELFKHTSGYRIKDNTRYVASEINCENLEEEFEIKSTLYYGSLIKYNKAQWGAINSYRLVETGKTYLFNYNYNPDVLFGGDTFICRFGFRSKLPFFLSSSVNKGDEAAINYDDLPNVAYPEFWLSSRTNVYNSVSPVLRNIISVRAKCLDCNNDQLITPLSAIASLPPATSDTLLPPHDVSHMGIMYTAAYGVPYFYCESVINTEKQHSFALFTGDHYPRVGNGIPDDWFQEANYPISLPNTYTYNFALSSPNFGTGYSTLPLGWKNKDCFTYYPNLAIYSDKATSDLITNNWLIYRPLSTFEFPQKGGFVVAIDGMLNRAVLVRQEGKASIYGAMLTLDTSNPKVAYVGTDSLFKSSPPIELGEAEGGIIGTRNKFLLNTPVGMVTVDADRGKVYLIQGTNNVTDITGGETEAGLFFLRHLPFKIRKYFKDVDVDNYYNGVGISGTYDRYTQRIIISKKDYVPLSDEIKYDPEKKEFYVEQIVLGAVLRKPIDLKDKRYFKNASFTVSYSLELNKWISFHSYIPDFFVVGTSGFYTGNQDGPEDIEAIVPDDGVPPETTTTTTLPPTDCELEGTIFIPDCYLQGTITIP